MSQTKSVDDLCIELQGIFPDFRVWMSHGSIFETYDGKLTYCGLFMELLHFLSNQPQQLSQTYLQLASVLESALLLGDSTQNTQERDFRGAVEICFLENLGGYPEVVDRIRPFLQKKSLKALELELN